jgi:hypothetical protein
MGTQYFVANAAKRQYFDPGRLGSAENTKRSGVLWGLSGHALAELLLPGADLGFYLSSWIGDPLFLFGDDATPNSIALLTPLQKSSKEQAYQIVTQSFDNVSINLIAQLCRSPITRDYMLDEAERKGPTFVDIVHAFTYLAHADLDLAVNMRFGANWRERYYATLRAEPWHYPLPLTPETSAREKPCVVRAIDLLRSGGHPSTGFTHEE